MRRPLARQVRQLEVQLEQLGHQRRAAEARVKEADQPRHEAESRLLLLQEQAASDRESQTRAPTPVAPLFTWRTPQFAL